MENLLRSKTILITGGTSRLGRAFVTKALAQGARVFFTYYQASQTASTLQAAGAQGYVLDLSSTSAMDDFCKTFKEQTNQLDILIHNAAAIRDHTLGNLTEEDWDYVMDVNLKAPFYLTKKLMPYFLRKKKIDQVNEKNFPKKIFMITSRAAVMAGFGISNYAASKAGLIGLVKSMAMELGSRQVLVNAVNPGFMMSSMTEHLPQEVLDLHQSLSPLDRFSDPEEVADFLTYLCSDHTTQVTGQVLHFESRKITG